MFSGIQVMIWLVKGLLENTSVLILTTNGISGNSVCSVKSVVLSFCFYDFVSPESKIIS